jgi:nucleoside-diphosphate-sugar epimerase
MSQSSPICVTGANGYIAGFVVQQLLELGHTVHGTVRDPNAEKNKFLHELPTGRGTLRLFQADLLVPGSFDEAIQGCEVVIHLAAVVKSHIEKDPFAEMIRPVVEGVKNIVQSCQKHHVRRIVYTSSVATILTIEKNRPVDRRGKNFTEDDWLTHVTPTYGTYNYAKVEAERELERSWQGELISLLPSWVIGPIQHAQTSGSQSVIRMIATRAFGPKLSPLMYIHWVDIRDVAKAHVWAATQTSVTRGRFNVAGPENVSSGTIAAKLNAIDPTLKLPERMIPWAVMWTMSWVDKRLTSHFLYEKAVPVLPIDSSRIIAAGFKFEHRDSLDETLKANLECYKKFGVVKQD